MMKKPTIPEFVEMRRGLVEDRLNNYVEAETGCWEYQGYCDCLGYGVLKISAGNGLRNTYNYRLHRLSYYYHKHTDPAALVVRHDCDNPCCINPAHLRLGTIRDNNNDCVERGRNAKGEKHWCSKLTTECVINIKKRLREGKETQVAIARDYGVVQSVISDIAVQRKWRHIQLPSETLTKELQNPHQLTLTL
jgi:hypothetical protein